VTRRQRRERRKDIAAALRLVGWLNASLDTPKTDDELLVEAWLWMVAEEDDVARACLVAIPSSTQWRRP
jgi:hypothetical protein